MCAKTYAVTSSAIVFGYLFRRRPPRTAVFLQRVRISRNADRFAAIIGSYRSSDAIIELEIRSVERGICSIATSIMNELFL